MILVFLIVFLMSTIGGFFSIGFLIEICITDKKKGWRIAFIVVCLLSNIWFWSSKAVRQPFQKYVEVCVITENKAQDGSIVQSTFFEGKPFVISEHVEGYFPGQKIKITKSIMKGLGLEYETVYNFILIE